MGIEHNYLAQQTSALLLDQLRAEQAPWAGDAGFTSRTVYGTSLIDWPRPDATFIDRIGDVSLAMEFKPPGQTKREYLTGLGQAISYLNTHQYSALIVPKLAGDGFEIGPYVQGLLEQPFAVALPVALFVYESNPGDEQDLTAKIGLRERAGAAVSVRDASSRRRMFWAYWRDASQHDVYEILLQIDRSTTGLFDSGYSTFWTESLSRGHALKWEGDRRRRYKATSLAQHRLNAHMTLLHIGLIATDGKLTSSGLELLQLGKVYGAGSVVFMRELARRVLDDGRHLELMFWVDQTQKRLPPRKKRTSRAYNQALDMALRNEGVIENVSNDSGKSSFLRDEQKLWNKLGLLERTTSARYFREGEGLRFDWRAITGVVGT
jgi:hypothetical protein